MAFAGEFTPENIKQLRKEGWLPCQGATELTEDFPELSNLIKGTYGDRGQTNQFQLPDFRSRGPVGAEKGEGTDGENREFTYRTLGNTFGSEKHTLKEPEMPSHTHSINGGPRSSEEGSAIIIEQDREPRRTAAINSTGSGKPHNNMQPSLAIHFIIKAKKI